MRAGTGPFPRARAKGRSNGVVKAATDAKPQSGKIDAHVHSKDHPVKVKVTGDAFREVKVSRGPIGVAR